MNSSENKDLRGTLTDSIAGDRAVNVQGANPDAFRERMNLLIEQFGSAAEIARRCGFSEAVVRSWRDGNSDPSRTRCIALAAGTGVALLWLVAGEGEMYPASHPVRRPDAHMELGLLGIAVRIADDVLEARGIRAQVPSATFAELCRVVFYELARGVAEDDAKQALDRIISGFRGVPEQEKGDGE